jgi:hypothetical protein
MRGNLGGFGKTEELQELMACLDPNLNHIQSKPYGERARDGLHSIRDRHGRNYSVVGTT